MAVGAVPSGTEYGSRPRSLGNGRLKRKERAELQALELSLAKGRHYANRPRTWSECQERIKGPCPWASCRFNLMIEVDENTGAVKLNHPDKEIDELEETCALRVAAEGGHTLERTGELVNIVIERTRQIERDALQSLKRKLEASDIFPPAFRTAIALLAAGTETRE